MIEKYNVYIIAYLHQYFKKHNRKIINYEITK